MQATVSLFYLSLQKKKFKKLKYISITNSNGEQKSVCSGDLGGLNLFRILSYDYNLNTVINRDKHN